MEFSKQEYWSELPFPSSGDLPNLGIEPGSPRIELGSSAMWETQAQSLGWGDPLEKGMATHSSILAWRIQWTEEPGGLRSIGLQRVEHD